MCPYLFGYQMADYWSSGRKAGSNKTLLKETRDAGTTTISKCRTAKAVMRKKLKI
jgi:hypothetical protein